MRSLIVGTITDVVNYNPSSKKHDYILNNFFDINSLFWDKYFDSEKMTMCLYDAETIKEDLPIKLKWAVLYKELFVEKVLDSWEMLRKAAKNPKRFYCCLETLQIMCEIYYYTYTKPFKLSVSEGFVRSSHSSYEMFYDCLLEYSNPYLSFIKNDIIPTIKDLSPKTVWITGKPNILSFAIAKIIKSFTQKIYVGISHHSSEYYSLNKILQLNKNTYLFKLFDFIVVNDDQQTIENVENAIESEQSFNQISNIIYTQNNGRSIHKTNFTQNKLILPVFDVLNQPLNIRLFPQHACYWSRCTFCGINNKYCLKEKNWDYDYAFSLLEHLHNNNIKSFWSLDEALPPEVLLKISEKIIVENWDFNWHTRTRVDSRLVDLKLCRTLRKSGLKNLLLGFESASERILKLMNKTNDPKNYVKTAEEIVRLYNRENISIHFPCIIGFPSETKSELEATIGFMKYMFNTYKLFSYNINILQLDISSHLYKNFEQYDIMSVDYPCQPSFFLENCVDWNPKNTIELKNRQKEGMKYQFKWYPDNSLIEIDEFYKLLEHTRTPFFYTEMYKKPFTPKIDLKNDCFMINKNTILLEYCDEKVLLNTETYGYVVGSDFFVYLSNLKEWTNCAHLMDNLPDAIIQKIIDLFQALVDCEILLIGGETNVC